MLKRSVAAAVLAAAALVVGCQEPRDPASVARAALEAYRDRDLSALAALTHPDNRAIFEELRTGGEGHPRWASLFSPDAWRWQAVERWDGRIGEVRYFGSGSGLAGLAAMVKFGEVSASEVLVVALERRDGRWWFDDINSPDAASYSEGRLAPP